MGESLPRVAAYVLATSLAGFGIHGAFSHRALAEREGGRPFFEPAAVRAAGVQHGLLLVDTDHAYNLGFDPDARDPSREFVVVRDYDDDRNRLVWERLGRPSAFRYLPGGSERAPSVIPWNPGPSPGLYRFEAEAEWPPLAQEGGYFEPTYASGTCAWGGRVLAIRSMTDRPFRGVISVPVPNPGLWSVTLHVVFAGESRSHYLLAHHAGEIPLATWTFDSTLTRFRCLSLESRVLRLTDTAELEVIASGDGISIDAIALEPLEPLEAGRNHAGMPSVPR